MLQGDIPASQMINSLPGVDPARRARVMQVLDIDPEWRMHRVSDGQRRRVQICMGLLKPPEVQHPSRVPACKASPLHAGLGKSVQGDILAHEQGWTCCHQ